VVALITDFRAVWLAVLVAAACGGTSVGTPGNASVSGLVEGRAFHARSALSVTVFTSNDDGNSAQVLLIEITDVADDCSNADYSAALHPNAQSLAFALSSLNAAGDAIPVGSGSYEVVDGSGTSANTAAVTYQSTDAACAMLPLAAEPMGMNGTVELDTVTAAGVRGSFDLVLTPNAMPADASHLSGAFDTIDCVPLAKQATGATACM
jgi:hypothetical protein